MKIYCVLFDAMPLCEEVMSVAAENNTQILRQIGGCFTTHSCIQMLTGKMPSDLEPEGIGYHSHHQYIKDGVIHWPWEDKIIYNRLLSHGWDVRYHNGEWFSSLLSDNPKIKKTSSIKYATPFFRHKKKSWYGIEIQKMLLGKGWKAFNFNRNESKFVQNVQSENAEKDIFHFMYYMHYHTSLEIGSKQDIAIQRLTKWMRQWDFNEPDALFWFFADHGSWVGVGEHPDPNCYMSWAMVKDNTANPVKIGSHFMSIGDFFPTIMDKLKYKYELIPDVSSIEKEQIQSRIYFIEDSRMAIDKYRSTAFMACKFIDWENGKPQAIIQVSYFLPKNEFACILTHLDDDSYVKSVTRQNFIDEELKKAVFKRYFHKFENSEFQEKFFSGSVANS